MYLLDTDTLIYIGKQNKAVLSNLSRLGESSIFIPIISLMELYYGAHKSSHPETNLNLVGQLRKDFPIIPLDESIAPTFGRIKAELEKKGKRLEDMDLMIAAMALTHQLILVTHNIRHFSRIERLKIEDWAID